MLPFVTAYDPLGRSSGSIDPLGALQSYGALADMLLPGITTITTRSRYLTMICAALANAETYIKFPPGSAGLSQRRESVESFERLWALACVAAREDGAKLATDGLRGITYADKIYAEFISKDRLFTPDFQMLKYQSRTGAVGTYWTSMVGGQLVHEDTGALMKEGWELAKTFPELPLQSTDRENLANNYKIKQISVCLEDLLEWGKECHLVAAKRNERRLLADALRADDRRDLVAQALETLHSEKELPTEWNIPWIKRLRRNLSSIHEADSLGLPIVIDAIVCIEQFHEAVLTMFNTLLWWGTINSNESLHSLLNNNGFKDIIEQARVKSRLLLEFYDTTKEINIQKKDIRTAIEGFVSFARDIERSPSNDVVVDETLRRHRQVQSGKLDGGVQKRDWIACDGRRLLRPSPRFQINDQPLMPDGKWFTHPYRLEQFVGMLRENRCL